MTIGRPRRRSIFSGVLLILLGVLFLWHNFRGDFGLWGLLERWWPLLLILWGLAKLYDHLAARRTGQAAPSTITGGEIFLVILLVVLVGMAGGYEWFKYHGAEYDIEFPFGQSYSFSEELPAQTVKADAQISINTDRGDISVRPEETPELRVLVRKTARAVTEEEAKKRAQQVAVVIVQEGGGYEVRPKGDGDTQRGVRIDLEVHVPKQAAIRVKTERGDAQVSGVAGPVQLTVWHGDLEVRDTGGDVRAEIKHGDARIVGAKGSVRIIGRGGDIEIADVGNGATVEGEFSGTTRVSKVANRVRFLSSKTDLTLGPLPGQLELDPGDLKLSGAAGNCSLITKNRTIQLDNVAGQVQIENRHGTIELNYSKPPREEISVVNDKADIELLLPSQSSFEMDAFARSGEIQNEFDDPGLRTTESKGDVTLRGKTGTKGPQIHLRTTYGTVRVRKGP